MNMIKYALAGLAIGVAVAYWTSASAKHYSNVCVTQENLIESLQSVSKSQDIPIDILALDKAGGKNFMSAFIDTFPVKIEDDTLLATEMVILKVDGKDAVLAFFVDDCLYYDYKLPAEVVNKVLRVAENAV